MSTQGIPVRSKLLLAIMATVILLLVLLFVLLDASAKIEERNQLLKSRSELLTELRSLEHSFFLLIMEGQTQMLTSCLEHARELESGIMALAAHPQATGIPQVDVKTSQIESTLVQLVGDLRTYPTEDSLQWNNARTDLQILGALVNDFDSLLHAGLEASDRRFKLQIGLALGLVLLLIGVFLSSLALNLHRSLEWLVGYTRKLKEGELPPALQSVSRDEFGEIATQLNTMTDRLQEKINFIESLSREGPVPNYTPSDSDQLGVALATLADTMSRRDLEEISRNREDKRQNWVSNGMAQMGEVLRSERENVAELSYSIIQMLVKYMKVEMGSLYITHEEESGEPYLDLSASYAYDRRKYRNARVEWGEGLPGTCAQEKKQIFLTEIPEHYFEISSGTGSVKPNCLLLVPMMIDEAVSGVIELATIRFLKPHEIDFVESLADSISSTLLAVRTNERNLDLLGKSQEELRELKDREATLTSKLEETEKKAAESGKLEREYSMLLQEVDQTVLVSEMGLNGRFTRVNEAFLGTFQSEKDQILGKQHRDFALVDPYSEEYKSFWEAMRSGERISKTEAYRLFSGKEIWLSQSFTPLKNEDGRVIRVLNIAVDVTEKENLKERLETSRKEISRNQLDMETLNEAVNSALIKCELDPEGIIMDVNENYCEVTGYGRKELLGRNYRLFLKDTEKDQFEKIWVEVGKQKVYEGVIRRSRPTGEEVWLVSTFSPVVDPQGVILKIYFMGLDITEKKLKYQLLEDANQEIERLKERLREFEK